MVVVNIFLGSARGCVERGARVMVTCCLGRNVANIGGTSSLIMSSIQTHTQTHLCEWSSSGVSGLE